MKTQHHFKHPTGALMIREMRFEGTPTSPIIYAKIYKAKED